MDFDHNRHAHSLKIFYNGMFSILETNRKYGKHSSGNERRRIRRNGVGVGRVSRSHFLPDLEGGGMVVWSPKILDIESTDLRTS
jgi:hypothetical protein